MSTTLTEVQKAASMLLDELGGDDQSRASSPASMQDLDDADGEDEPRGFIPPPIVLPAQRPTPSEPSAVSTPHGRSRVLPRLLAMADTYRRSGSLHQAIEIYFEIVRVHAGTPQASQAEDRLIEVARGYEQTGELRQARGIYEQLL